MSGSAIPIFFYADRGEVVSHFEFRFKISHTVLIYSFSEDFDKKLSLRSGETFPDLLILLRRLNLDLFT